MLLANKTSIQLVSNVIYLSFTIINCCDLDVKQTLKKLLTCVKWDKASDMRKAAVDSLISIHPINPSQFKSQILAFNNTQLEDLVKLLLPKIPTLLEEEPEEKAESQDKAQDTENLTSSGNLITSRKQVENGLEELSPTCDFDVNSPNKLPTSDAEPSDVVVNDNAPSNEQEPSHGENNGDKQTNGDDTKHEPETNHVEVAEPSSTPSSHEILNNSNAPVNNNNVKSISEEDFDIDLTAAKEALEKPKVDLSSLVQLLASNSAVERGNGYAALIDFVIDDEVSLVLLLLMGAVLTSV